MIAHTYVALALQTAMQAWSGDSIALRRLNLAAARLGHRIDADDLGELKAHSQWLENLAWGLKELETELPSLTSVQNYVATALDLSLRAWAGDDEAFALLNRAAEMTGSGSVSSEHLAEIKLHSRLLENIAWGLKELDSEPAL